MGKDVTIELNSKNVPKIVGGKVSFNMWKNYTYVKYPSQEYDAWRAFMRAAEPYAVVIFILNNWAVFKKSLPITSIWFDLNRCNVKKLRLEIKKNPISIMDKYSTFYNALKLDIQCLEH